MKKGCKFFSSVVIDLFHSIFLFGWSHIEFRLGFATIVSNMLTITARSYVQIRSNIILKYANHTPSLKPRNFRAGEIEGPYSSYFQSQDFHAPVSSLAGNCPQRNTNFSNSEIPCAVFNSSIKSSWEHFKREYISCW